MQRVCTVEACRSWRAALPSGASVGFVPTMGGLHAGHLELLARARERDDFVLASLFVNRPQFNDSSDFESYPADFEEDVAALSRSGVDAVFCPSEEEIYADGYRYALTEKQGSRELEGAFRPGHFDGVLTVVLKLLMIAAPRRAYFGEKDWQQLQLVKGMAEAFFLPLEIVACPTVREASGLALSSRNRRLSPEGRERAARFSQILAAAGSELDAAAELEREGFEVEYVAAREGRRLGAVVLEGVRLIDNLHIGAASGAGEEQVR